MPKKKNNKRQINARDLDLINDGSFKISKDEIITPDDLEQVADEQTIETFFSDIFGEEEKQKKKAKAIEDNEFADILDEDDKTIEVMVKVPESDNVLEEINIANINRDDDVTDEFGVQEIKEQEETAEEETVEETEAEEENYKEAEEEYEEETAAEEEYEEEPQSDDFSEEEYDGDEAEEDYQYEDGGYEEADDSSQYAQEDAYVQSPVENIITNPAYDEGEAKRIEDMYSFDNLEIVVEESVKPRRDETEIITGEVREEETFDDIQDQIEQTLIEAEYHDFDDAYELIAPKYDELLEVEIEKAPVEAPEQEPEEIKETLPEEPKEEVIEKTEEKEE